MLPQFWCHYCCFSNFFPSDKHLFCNRSPALLTRNELPGNEPVEDKKRGRALNLPLFTFLSPKWLAVVLLCSQIFGTTRVFRLRGGSLGGLWAGQGTTWSRPGRLLPHHRLAQNSLRFTISPPNYLVSPSFLTAISHNHPKQSRLAILSLSSEQSSRPKENLRRMPISSLSMHWHLQKLREDFPEKNTLSCGHCQNCSHPLPPPSHQIG